jgi:Putative adhesin
MTTQTQPVAPAPYRTPAAVRLALYVLFGLGGLFLVFNGAVSLLDQAARKTTVQVTSYSGVRALVVDDAGDVRLTSAPAGGELRVRARVTAGLRSPDRDVEQSDGTLRLSSSCQFLLGGDNCGVEYEIALPPGTNVRVDATAGDVRAEDLRSTVPVELESSAGDVTAVDVIAPELRLSSSAGDVEATGVRAERVTAESSAGDVTMSLRDAPRSVDADSSAGDVEVVVPDQPYQVDASSSAGDVDTRRVDTDPDSNRVIRVRSSAGDVTVEARR